MTELERTIEALLFLSPEPVSTAELAEACDVTEAEVDRSFVGLVPSLV
jgi:chromosome segregation and condensation protein ScpB